MGPCYRLSNQRRRSSEGMADGRNFLSYLARNDSPKFMLCCKQLFASDSTAESYQMAFSRRDKILDKPSTPTSQL